MVPVNQIPHVWENHLQYTIPQARTRPQRIPGNMVERSGNDIPLVISLALHNGWKKHIPLSYLMPTYLQNINKGRTVEPNISLAQDKPSVGDFLEMGEKNLDFTEWFQVSCQFTKLLKANRPDKAPF